LRDVRCCFFVIARGVAARIQNLARRRELVNNSGHERAIGHSATRGRNGRQPRRSTRRVFAIAVAAFLLLFMWKAPPWLMVVFCALGGEALSLAVFGH